MQIEPNKYVKELTQAKYKYGFTTDVHTDIIEKGLNEDVVRLISSKKGEPDWLLEFRLKAFRYWQTLEMPTWAHLNIPEIDYQAISYYADPTKKKEGPKSLDEVDPELLKTFDNPRQSPHSRVFLLRKDSLFHLPAYIYGHFPPVYSS